LIKKIDQGKINFDVLLAAPAMMPKLAKYAKVLGPKGLMPNPKNNTISNEPEKLVKQMQGKTPFKAEVKFPLIHQVIGKVKDSEKNLEENFLALVNAVGPGNINKAVITPSMGPGIKVNLDSRLTFGKNQVK